jgi:hypothetical protein
MYVFALVIAMMGFFGKLILISMGTKEKADNASRQSSRIF